MPRGKDARATKAGRRAALLASFVLAPAAELAARSHDVDPFHWGYAAAFGSGTYRLGDGTQARVYRAPVSTRLRATPTNGRGGPGVRLLLPVTLGVQDLEDDRLPPERSSDRLEQAALLPGVELELAVGERWTIRGSGQIGWGEELRGAESSARLAAAGVRTRFGWPDARLRPGWISGLLWAGFDPDEGERGSFLRFTQAVELTVDVPRWRFRDRPMMLRPHLLHDWFYRPPRALAFGAGGFEQLESEWQVGVAAIRDSGFRLLGFRFDGVGIAYRFSEHSEGIKLYLNSVF